MVGDNRRFVLLMIAASLIGFCSMTLWGVEPKLEEAGQEVFVNQVGYLPEAPKTVVSAKAAEKFTVIDLDRQEEVFQGLLKPYEDPTSRQTIWVGSFTPINTPGRYRAFIPEVGWSYAFSIDNALYNQVLDLGARFYYLQRCGVDLEDEETGLAHPACHLKDGVIARTDEFHQTGESISSLGGWHDAGDYGKYTTTTTVTVAHLLTAYELWPGKFIDNQFRIPESGNGIPDILDEALVGVEWLFTMQRADGAVYHKLSGRSWPGMGTDPDFDRQTRYIYGISTADTGKYAATMAIVARVFQKSDPELARRAEDAAKKAWDFLINNKYIWDHTGFDDEGSGAYGSETDWTDRIWAALEMAVLTGDDSYLSTIVDEEYALRGSYQPAPLSWSDMSLLGLFHYARDENALPELKERITAVIKERADYFLAAAKSSGYRYTLKFDEFGWASNKEGLSRGITILLADELRPNPEYREAALAQLDFVLGLNPLSKCFVAGLGANSIRSPHHRMVIGSRRPVPGLLVGGPNNNSESGVEPKNQGPFSYADSSPSYSSNETAIDYNAALVFMAAAFSGWLE